LAARGIVLHSEVRLLGFESEDGDG